MLVHVSIEYFFVYQETQAIDINLCLVLVVFLQGLRFVCLCFLWMFEESPPGNSHICWKLIVGRWSSFSNGPFSGDMFIFKGVFVILWFYVFKCCFMWFFWLTLPMSKNGRMWMKMLPPSTSFRDDIVMFPMSYSIPQETCGMVTWGKTGMQMCWGMDGNFDEYPNWNQQITMMTGCWKMSIIRLPLQGFQGRLSFLVPGESQCR